MGISFFWAGIFFRNFAPPPPNFAKLLRNFAHIRRLGAMRSRPQGQSRRWLSDSSPLITPTHPSYPSGGTSTTRSAVVAKAKLICHANFLVTHPNFWNFAPKVRPLVPPRGNFAKFRALRAPPLLRRKISETLIKANSPFSGPPSLIDLSC